MKINANQLRKIILQEMRHMHKRHDDHSEMMDVLMHSAQGCPIKARGMLQKMLSRIEPMAHERETELQRSNPRSNPDNIPQGSEVLSDDQMEETKETKVTAVEGPGNYKGILGPGFR